jgi:CrcB protein
VKENILPDKDLPVDSDLVGGGSYSVDRPPHLRWQYIGLVTAGGTVGTAAREALNLSFPAIIGVPWIILVINVVGAFILGLLLESLTRRGPDDGRRRLLRLAIGTGVLGGFTTYSSLAAGTAVLLQADRVGVAVGYALATVVLGAFGTVVGLSVGKAVSPKIEAAQ